MASNQPARRRHLAREIELNREFESDDEVVLLSLLRTHQLIERTSALYFARFELTATQFNALMIVRDWETEGVKASELARRLVINRASAGALVDGLCRRGLIERRPVPDDRRAYHLVLTDAGRDTLARLLPGYYALLEDGLAGFPERRKQAVVRFLGELREKLAQQVAALSGEEVTR